MILAVLIEIKGHSRMGWNPILECRPFYTKRQRQRCNDPCDTVLIDHNRVTPFSSNSIVANESCVASVIAALTLGVNGSSLCLFALLVIALLTLH